MNAITNIELTTDSASSTSDWARRYNPKFNEGYFDQMREVIRTSELANATRQSAAEHVQIFDQCVSKILIGTASIIRAAGLDDISKLSAYQWHQFYHELHLNRTGVSLQNSNKAAHETENVDVLLHSLSKAGLIPPYWSPRVLSEKNPFFVFHRFDVIKGPRPIYEFSEFGPTLGYRFVIDACKVVTSMRIDADVVEQTWIHNYVTKIKYLFETLREFLKSGKLASVESMSNEQWKQFLDYIATEIYSDAPSEKTGAPRAMSRKNCIRFNLNNLFGRLAIARVIPERYEIPNTVARRIAKAGLSEFTKRKFIRSKNEDFVESELSFWVDSHKRGYDYSQFQDAPRIFLLWILPTTNSFYSSLSPLAAKKIHQALCSFLGFLADQQSAGADKEFFELLSSEHPIVIGDLLWEKKIYEWREAIISENRSRERPSKPITVSAIFKKLNRLWTELSFRSLVPALYIKGIKNARQRSEQQGRASLAQLQTEKPTRIFPSKTTAIIENLSKFFDDAEKREATQFISVLCESLSAAEIRRLTLDGLLEKIRSINHHRLALLRQCAESEFIRWHAHWKLGQLAIKSVDLTKEELVDLLDNPRRSFSERRKNAARLLGNDATHQLGNSLNLIIAQYDGIITSISGRYHHMRRRLGGDACVHAYLHPHPNAMVALWTILLIDTGANCEVVREMPFDCLQKCSDPGYMKISFGLKARSNYKRISDQLSRAPEKDQQLSAIDAVIQYQEMTRRYRQLAVGNIGNLLFLTTRNAGIIGLTEFEARKEFISFRDGRTELKGLQILPSSIRPSYLLKVQHDDPKGRLEVAQSAADHLSATMTADYTGRAPTKIMYVQKIREFQDLFQIVIISSIDGAAEKLGISKDDAERLFSEASRSGLGIACLNSRAGIQPGTKPGGMPEL
jgi:hypothetical protein